MTDEMMTDAEWEASATISQTALFEPEQYDQWRDLWVDMPAFNSDDERPFDNINVQFSNAEDRRQFLIMMGERPDRRKSIWFPSIGYLRMSERDATPTTVPPGRYPIYVISKGRSETRLTSNALERLGLHYRLVIEPQEETAYAAHPYKYGQLLVTPFRAPSLSVTLCGSTPSRRAPDDTGYWMTTWMASTGLTTTLNIESFMRTPSPRLKTGWTDMRMFLWRGCNTSSSLHDVRSISQFI
jgi:hypothetical protein